MYVADHGVGELMVKLRMLADAPVCFEPPIHPLDVLLRDEGDLLAAELRLDVEVYVAAVALKRAGAHCARLVLCEPAVEPFAERHAAVLGQLHIAVALDVLMELVQQSLLRLGIDVAEQRLAVILVADDDTAFPAPVVTLAHHAVAGRPSFCHVLHFL